MKKLFPCATMLLLAISCPLIPGCKSTDVTADQASVEQQRAATFVKTLTDLDVETTIVGVFPLNGSVWAKQSFGIGNGGHITVLGKMEPKSDGGP